MTILWWCDVGLVTTHDISVMVWCRLGYHTWHFCNSVMQAWLPHMTFLQQCDVGLVTTHDISVTVWCKFGYHTWHFCPQYCYDLQQTVDRMQDASRASRQRRQGNSRPMSSVSEDSVKHSLQVIENWRQDVTQLQVLPSVTLPAMIRHSNFTCSIAVWLQYLMYDHMIELPAVLPHSNITCSTTMWLQYLVYDRITVWLRYLLKFLTVTLPVASVWLQYLVYDRMIMLPAVISHSNITCSIAVWLQYLVYDYMITLPAVISYSNIACSIAVWLQYLVYDCMITLPAVLPHSNITCSIAVWLQYLVYGCMIMLPCMIAVAITVYFIHPSRKWKLLSDHTTRNISQ